MIELEVVASCTLDRHGERVTLRPGARLKIDAQDDSFSDRQLRRAIAEGRLRPIAGLAALARRFDEADGFPL